MRISVQPSFIHSPSSGNSSKKRWTCINRRCSALFDGVHNPHLITQNPYVRLQYAPNHSSKRDKMHALPDNSREDLVRMPWMWVRVRALGSLPFLRLQLISDCPNTTLCGTISLSSFKSELRSQLQLSDTIAIIHRIKVRDLDGVGWCWLVSWKALVLASLSETVCV